MSKWVLRGLGTGIVTTEYPKKMETAPGISPGRPEARIRPGEQGQSTISKVPSCPTGALRQGVGGAFVDYKRCIHCYRCVRGTPFPLDWKEGYEWAGIMMEGTDRPGFLGKAFARSLHVRFVDAGACGACISEIELVSKPHYNLHRLGFFITPTPRDADVLLVAGPGTDHMRLALRKAYEAMPTPKTVVAVGTCALSGGIFGPSFASSPGVAGIVPVEVGVPGCPPPPLAILHGLLVAVQRKQPALLSMGELKGVED